jgi:hypothetical protein
MVSANPGAVHSDIHFFFDEIDRAIGGDDLHPDQG